jgi:putative heme-binding domain-containing protein
MRLARAAILFILPRLLFLGFATTKAQAQRSDDAGAQQFMEYCAGCHGADGRGGGKAPSLVAPSDIATRTDTDVFRIVHDGSKEGMPPFAQIGDANIEALVQYVRRLAGNVSPAKAPEEALPGDADAGRALYFGKARCSNCHLMQGNGGFIAMNLTHYGRTRTSEAILQAITQPDNPLVPSSEIVTVKTVAGTTVTGALRNEDAFTLAVQTDDGRFHLLARSDLTAVHYTGRSLMPRDYATRLSTKELNDIVSFLIAEGRNTHSAGAAGQVHDEHSPTDQ